MGQSLPHMAAASGAASDGNHIAPPEIVGQSPPHMAASSDGNYMGAASDGNHIAPSELMGQSPPHNPRATQFPLMFALRFRCFRCKDQMKFTSQIHRGCKRPPPCMKSLATSKESPRGILGQLEDKASLVACSTVIKQRFEMETCDRINAGLTAESPDMAPRPSESGPNQFLELSLATAGSRKKKKKRGIPRKYDTNGAPLPMQISSSAPPPLRKRGRGKKRMGFHTSGGERFGVGVGSNFTPHIITVNTGEDIIMRVISFSQRAICILSANGVISNVTLRQPHSCAATLTYEGRFEILSLSGSFIEKENQGSIGRSGGMSVSLAGHDGRVVGGGVVGLLIKATPIQVVVGSFVTSVQQEHQKPRKQRVEQTSATVMSLPPPPASVFSSQPPSSFGISSWTNRLDNPRNSATDINISLPSD